MAEVKTQEETRSKKQENLVEIWTDTVSISNLLMSLIISTVLTLGAYLMAPNESPKPLIFGLLGALVAFVINTIIFKPKRNLKEE